MKIKMGKRVMVTLMAVMLLMATNVTVFAGNYDARIQNEVLGTISKELLNN